MNRRTVLAAVATATTTGLSGCTAGGGGDGTAGGSPSPGSAPTVDSSTLDATGDCSVPNTASVAVDAAVVVTGCIQGPNGCHQPVLADVTVDGETLEVVVTTEARGGDGCTQALVQRGYEATVTFDGDRPATVTVVHDSMGSRETVATAER
ncbi:hypothetical protein SAMN04487949_0499 [Halogranum gelatinilyticum]|uniref:Uncharacterized protein n=1 Tax=Halogranum gelatinilyticum TaxID=660521 RepID=A0A1G9PRC6_9EURY|nr:hypothetical protein [Halogranum gelatinilyticum]SDM01368.1 hypothetical protein SAMN04487949_0499 [Halogranum gelatinilyticum]